MAPGPHMSWRRRRRRAWRRVHSNASCCAEAHHGAIRMGTVWVLIQKYRLADMDIEETATRVFGRYKESIIRECEQNKYYTLNILESIVESVKTVSEDEFKRDLSQGIFPFFSLGALRIESKPLYQVLLISAMSVVQQTDVCMRAGLVFVCKVILKVIRQRDSESIESIVERLLP